MASAPSNHRRVIIVLSDGDDNFSEAIRELSIAEARATQKAIIQEQKRRDFDRILGEGTGGFDESF